MEPFLKWAGGKRWLVPHIRNHLPAYKRYFEPFIGSGALYFALEPTNAILSDTNPELINCYRRIRDECESIIRILTRLSRKKETYYRVRDRLYRRADPIHKVAYFIFLNRLCWNGLYRVNRQGNFNVPFGASTLKGNLFDPSHLRAIQKLLRRTKLKCCDFEVAVKDAVKGDLVYFDPPYITTHMKNGFIKYNSKLFHEADELRLAHVATELAKKGVYVIASNAAHPLIKQQYNGEFLKTEIERASSIAADPTKRSRFMELLISNVDFEEQSVTQG